MTHTTHAVRHAVLATLALLTVGASAPADTESTFPGNWLYVSLTRDGAQAGAIRSALLLCDPPQGHTRAAQACAELRDADGDINRIPHKNSICTQIYAPIRATARGEWNGRQVTYEQTFANGCVLTARTGAVFALSDESPAAP
ncbi:serine protease [Streptomyces ipomoeae]|jgi:hypothetical protein|uniref:Subtilisin inhibitor-like protein n=2 Tax=Streptomyces ipomoeae TaxID=103232 RepID=L1L398_9ACTN|nr:SSI family serine proteinase inhibitor [Streptomyces ipomoeae]EKX67093.1 subtilisin inhibitor-like protein [Streptomyces ipomoeae 91-03]MDX2699870.1 SSI family serine proteinase inhibitor [Streptomyces ipomoeae]MDX2827396.1 SSI family serine proteinase inhibitor [Streptomyces ipomoeae]MDX2845519.1 SSI family serine proteinase inhibitor [Streptomyces ipomoeae]MDX2880001.1 SSI family serine proteinase inhibitor [Streptomyces ipomoeae]